MRQARLIGHATPTNLEEELGRLQGIFQRGGTASPRFHYRPRPLELDLVRQLERAADQLAERGPLGRIYAQRAEEIALELRLCHAVGRPGFAPLARRRFTVRDGYAAAAHALSAQWLQHAVAPPHEPLVRSDDLREPRSLLNRMRTEVGRHRLDVRVVATADMAALAATAPGVIYVAAGRWLPRTDVERTVLHEVHGHALPRRRAEQATLGIFACGTALGSDEQEGRALVLEAEAGWLDARRQQELALRHLAARSVRQGATFVETTQRLAQHPISLQNRLRIAARVHRGGGLAREWVYLPAFLRVQAARHRPGVDEVLAAGRVAVGAAPHLRPWVGCG